MFKYTQIFILLLLTIFLKFSDAAVGVSPSKITDYPIGYQYDGERDYYTTWNLFKSQTELRKDIKITFNCTKNGDSRSCGIESSLPLNRIWGHYFSEACGTSYEGIETDCTINLCDGFVPKPYQVKLSRRVPTSGGFVTISGKNLRLCTGSPQQLLVYIGNGLPAFCPIEGNIEDDSFDCENLVVNLIPGSGRGKFQFQGGNNGFVPFIFDAPIVNLIIYDKLSLTLNGDNFYIDNSLVKISFDNVSQTDFSITKNHTQIVINNFKRIYGGPMNISIIVNTVPMEVASYYCFHPILESVSSVSSNIGGVVTIIGKLFPQSGTSASLVNITIGSEKCYYLKSTNATIECELILNNKANNKETQLVTISINNTESIQCSGDNQLNFSYNIPNIINAIQKVGSKNVTLNGSVFGSKSTTQVILNGDYKIIQFMVSDNETILEFELPELKCGNINIKVINDGNPSNEILFNAEILFVPYHSPFVNNGSDLSLYIKYIKCTPVTLGIIPTLTYDSNTTSTPCSIATDVGEYYSTTCNVLPGTGSQHIVTIGYDGQSYETEFSYASPLVLDYSINITNPTVLTIYGVNFNTNIDLFSATFSNRAITPIKGTLKDNEFKFILNDNDENSYINITVDGIKNENDTFIHLSPKEINFDESQRISTHNGKFEITGKNIKSPVKSIKPEYQIEVHANETVCQTKSTQDNLLIAEMPDGAGVLYVSVLVGGNIVKSSNIRFFDHIVTSNNAFYDDTLKNMTINFIGSNFSNTAQIFLTDYSELKFIPCDIDFDTNISIPFTESNKLICKFGFSKKIPFLITELHIGGFISNHNITVIDVESLDSSLYSDDGFTNDGKKKIAAGVTVAGAFCLSTIAVCVKWRELIKKKILSMLGKSTPQ